jgi:hypothetical protein
MYRFIFFTCLLFLGLTAQSQILISLLLGDKLNSPGLEFGLEGGVNFTNISGFESNSSLPNLNLGLYFDILVKDQWYLYTGVQVKSSLGIRKLTENDLAFLQADTYNVKGNYKQKVNGFMVPLLANYKFRNHFYVEAGPQLGLLYNSWVQYNSHENKKYVKIKDYNEGMINWFNAGLAAGAGYKLMNGNGITIGIRYYQAFTDVFKDKSGSRNNAFHIKVNVPVGANKAEKK